MIKTKSITCIFIGDKIFLWNSSFELNKSKHIFSRFSSIQFSVNINQDRNVKKWTCFNGWKIIRTFSFNTETFIPIAFYICFVEVIPMNSINYFSIRFWNNTVFNSFVRIFFTTRKGRKKKNCKTYKDWFQLTDLELISTIYFQNSCHGLNCNSFEI